MTKDQEDHARQLQEMIRRIAALSFTAESDAASKSLVPIDAAEFQALKFIGDRGSVRMRDLAAHLGMPPSSATDLADKLIEKKLAERTRNDVDRRIVLLSLTRRGARLWSNASEEHLRLCREMLEGFPPAERERLVEMMTRLAGAPAQETIDDIGKQSG